MPQLRRRLALLVSALAAAGTVLAIALFAVPSASAVETGVWYKIISRHSGLALDIRDGSTEPGAELNQWNDTGARNQQFRFLDSGGGYHRIQARHSGLVLDVWNWNADNGATIAQYDDLNGTNQQWQIQESGGYATFVNRFSGKALDVWEWSTEPGTRISQYDPAGGANQQFELVPVSDDGGPSPTLPGLFADPNITYFDGRYYLYPTTDGYPGWSGTQYRAFSSADLVNWTDHGVILDVAADVSWADNSAWAPGIAEKDGKYYFYFSGGRSSGDTRKQLGVAVSDSPTGPFTDALGHPLVSAGSYAGQAIDPAVFTDDEGQSYLYWGQGASHQVPLNDDMVSFDASQVRTYDPPGYNEASFVIERNGTYYFMWSENDTRSEDYRVNYATSSSPLGPWSAPAGVILQKDPSQGILGTGHNSVVQAPGTDQWYIAYHRFAIPNGDGTHRETMVDRLYFNADGSIRPVIPTPGGIDPI
nr:family 43 glycosylhydrolase [Glycomyces tenuis]